MSKVYLPPLDARATMDCTVPPATMGMRQGSRIEFAGRRYDVYMTRRLRRLPPEWRIYLRPRTRG